MTPVTFGDTCGATWMTTERQYDDWSQRWIDVAITRTCVRPLDHARAHRDAAGVARVRFEEE